MKTASCVVRGLNRMCGLMTACRIPSYLAKAALADPMNLIKGFQSSFSIGNLAGICGFIFIKP